MKTDPNAHQLAKWIEALENGELSLEDIAALPEESALLVQLAAELRDLPSAHPSPEFRRSARARLMGRIGHAAPIRPRIVIPHHQRPQAILFRPVTRVVAVIALLLVFLTTGTVYASTCALPGDLVYPLKGWVEAARLRFSPAEQGNELRQQFARERTDEIQALIERERFSDLAGAYDAVEKQVEMFRLTPVANDQIRSLQAELSRQSEVLSTLLDTVSEDARPALEQAVDANNRSQERLTDLTVESTPPGPPGQADKERSPGAPPLPTQAGPKTNSQAETTESPVEPNIAATPEATPDTEETGAEEPAFVPPGLAGKDDEKTKPNPPRGPNASNGRGKKGRPNGPPGLPPFLRTETPANP